MFKRVWYMILCHFSIHEQRRSSEHKRCRRCWALFHEESVDTDSHRYLSKQRYNKYSRGEEL